LKKFLLSKTKLLGEPEYVVQEVWGHPVTISEWETAMGGVMESKGANLNLLRTFNSRELGGNGGGCGQWPYPLVRELCFLRITVETES
jgi:hypothetical protein